MTSIEIIRRIPYNPKLKDRAKDLRKNMTHPEKKLWFNFFQNIQKSKIRVLRQRPIDNFIVDFYIPSLKIVIEIDGDSHFDEQGKTYDIERTAILEGYGLEVIRFTNTDVIRNFEGVCELILKKIKKGSQ